MKTIFLALIFVLAASFSATLAQTAEKKGATKGVTTGPTTGMCSFYSSKNDGHPTTSGEKFDSKAFTAAHLHYPLGTKLNVTNLANNKSVVVTVNDRGPHTKGMALSVTRRAAEELGFIDQGRAKVRMEPVQ